MKRSQERAIEEAYRGVMEIARTHYENFPVVSRLLPRRKRRHIAAIYVFARRADDYADEGETMVEERLRALDLHEARLDRALRGEGEDPAFMALGMTLQETGLPDRLLRDLLTAFRHDAREEGYRSLEELRGYCRNSANPIGRLLLHLYGFTSPEQLRLSDEVCTGLQLVNFWQDLSIDLPRDRITIPRDTLEEYGVTIDDLHAEQHTPDFLRMMEDLTEIAEGHLLRGKELIPLIPDLPLRIQLKGTILGGLTIVRKIRGLNYRLLSERPVVGKRDLPGLLIRSLLPW